ncbi:hypothetical protein L2095_07850 [Bacillus zanthoxyli]|nr:hypothetical protein [Bacillus zanthoxyli]
MDIKSGEVKVFFQDKETGEVVEFAGAVDVSIKKDFEFEEEFPWSEYLEDFIETFDNIQSKILGKYFKDIKVPYSVLERMSTGLNKLEKFK